MNFNQEQRLVKELHDTSGMPYLKCREALRLNNWNLEAAKKWLREEIHKSMKRFGGVLDG